MKLNREQAIKIAGIKNVEKVESRSCVPTSRLIYPSFEPEHEGMQEFTASIRFNEGNTLTAYYYQTNEDIEENQEDLSMLDWNIDHYEID